MRGKFQNMLVSLLRNTDTVISLNVVTDVKSRYTARDVVENARTISGKYLNVGLEKCLCSSSGAYGSTRNHRLVKKDSMV